MTSYTINVSSTLPRAWIRLPSGGRLDLLNPSTDGWTDSDLAMRLSRTYRWGGESAWPLPLSVAQHSLTVLALRREAAGGRLSADQQLKELLHDAEEGFLGVDMISPLKAHLGQPFKDVSDRLMEAIEKRYAIPGWTPEDHKLHKEADLIAAASEAVHVIGWTPQEVREVLGITHPIIQNDPLPCPSGYAPWEPWPPDLAAGLFLSELNGLLLTRRAEEALSFITSREQAPTLKVG